MQSNGALNNRIPEPELMDEEAQVVAYAEADFDAGHQVLFEHATSRLPKDHQVERILDLGCGPGDFSRRLARHFSDAEVVAMDGAPNMLKRAASDPASSGLNITWVASLLSTFDDSNGFDLIFSNSLLHHLHAPAELWRIVKSVAREGAWVHISDLRRPETIEEATELVQTYASEEPSILQRDFYNSLCAAFTPREVEKQLREGGLGGLQVEALGDRHIQVFGRLDTSA